MLTDGAVRQFRGTEFQSLGAATEKRRASVSKTTLKLFLASVLRRCCALGSKARKAKAGKTEKGLDLQFYAVRKIESKPDIINNDKALIS